MWLLPSDYEVIGVLAGSHSLGPDPTHYPRQGQLVKLGVEHTHCPSLSLHHVHQLRVVLRIYRHRVADEVPHSPQLVSEKRQ